MVFFYFHGKGIDALSEYQLQNLKKYGVERMLYDKNPDSFEVLNETLSIVKFGDKIIVDSCMDLGKNLQEVIKNTNAILSKQGNLIVMNDGLNSSQVDSPSFKKFMTNLACLDEKKKQERIKNGIEKAKKEGKYTGRKPISIDNELFNDVIDLWEQGKITARQAMKELKLKPNTFYRRVKERTDIMKNQEEIIDAAKKLGKELKKGVEYTIDDLEELVENVKKDYEDGTLAEKFQKEYADKKELLDYYYDNAKDDVKRKFKEVKDYVDLKMEVNKETRDFKNK